MKQANDTLQLTLLASKETTQIVEILKQQQKNILTQAALFIPAVLLEEEGRYHQIKDNGRCQKTPWDQVIPLFDHGVRSIQSFPMILAQAITDWEQALKLLLHPPQEQEKSQQWDDTFRQIQEMYLQDQSEPDQSPKELHSW